MIKIRKIILIALILALIISLTSCVELTTLPSGCQENKDDFGLLIPLGGRIECEQIDPVATTVTEFQEEGTIIICGDNENTKKCGEVEVSCSKDDLIIAVRFDPKYRPQFKDICPIGGIDLCKLDFPEDTGLKNNFVRTEITSMEQGEKIEILCAGHLFGIQTGNYYSGRVRENYIAYGLNQYEQDRKIRLATESCNIIDLDQATKDSICKQSSKNNLNNQEVCEESGTFQTTGTIPFDDWTNYISKWVYAPAEMNLVTYKGKESYCSLGQIYDIGIIQLSKGCYKYPSNKVADVDCCPSESTHHMYCTDNFEWVEGGKPCYSDIDCQSEPSCNPNTFTVSEERCVDNDESSKRGFCTKIDEKPVSCCPPSYGCTSGICSIEDGYKCTTKPICDYDGVCEAGENLFNCREDCIEEEKIGKTECETQCDEKYGFLEINKRQGCYFKCKIFNNLQYIIMVILILIAIIILALKLTKKKRRKKR